MKTIEVNDNAIMIDGQQVLNVIENLAKDANASHRNHAYWKGLRDAHRAIYYLVETEARKEIEKNGSHETGRFQTVSDIPGRKLTPVHDGVEGDNV